MHKMPQVGHMDHTTLPLGVTLEVTDPLSFGPNRET